MPLQGGPGNRVTHQPLVPIHRFWDLDAVHNTTLGLVAVHTTLGRVLVREGAAAETRGCCSGKARLGSILRKCRCQLSPLPLCC